MAPSAPTKPFRVSDRTLVAVSALGTAAFVACYAVAIALYPGGTWWNRHAPGHSLAKNFLCDLMQTRALNGVEAPVGSVLARLGIVAMLLALAAFYSQVARLESPVQRAGRIAERAGVLACVLGLAVPIATSDQHRVAHLISVVGAFLPSLVATIFALVVTLRVKNTSWWLRGVATVTLLAGAIDGLLYAYVYAIPMLGLTRGSPATRQLISASLPMFQRIATIGLVAWVMLMCLRSFLRIRRSATNTATPAE